MTSIKLASITILMTLIIQSIPILGETLLAAETTKEGGLKPPEKRNNFRVPMEMPYDPNFWPARGRRSRRDPEKLIQLSDDNCITPEGSYIFDKIGVQCPELSKIRTEDRLGKKLSDVEFLPPVVGDEDLLSTGGESKMEADCTKEKFGVKIPEVLETNVLMNPKRVDKFHKKQRHYRLPPIILYGNGFYFEPENLYGEKKKKQDVFWVARGKKNFNLDIPQK